MFNFDCKTSKLPPPPPGNLLIVFFFFLPRTDRHNISRQINQSLVNVDHRNKAGGDFSKFLSARVKANVEGATYQRRHWPNFSADVWLKRFPRPCSHLLQIITASRSVNQTSIAEQRSPKKSTINYYFKKWRSGHHFCATNPILLSFCQPM